MPVKKISNMTWYFIILALLLLGFCFLRCSKKEIKLYPFKKAELSYDCNEFIELLNAYREDNGLDALEVDHLASLIEAKHVDYMLINGVSHENQPERILQLLDFGAEDIEEIVCGGFSSVKTAFGGFKQSPSHDSVLLSDSDACGVSVKTDENGKYFVAVITFKI